MKNNWLQNRIQKTQQFVTKKVAKKIEKQTLDESAASALKLYTGLIGRQFPIAQVRAEVVKSINTDAEYWVKEKGLTESQIIENCIKSPNYIKLLDYVGLNIEHVRAAVKAVRDKQ